MSAAIAVVGMACRFPDAGSPEELWQTVMARRRAFRRLPAERLRLEDYHSNDRTVADTTYSTQAAVLENWEFDRVRFRVVGSTFRSADLAHWLALEVADAALDDAGFAMGDGLPKATTGAIVGNTLTGEFSRANSLRLRWPFVRRTVGAELARSGLSRAASAVLLRDLEERYKRPFQPVEEETLAGALSNTIAGRICNHFDLQGGGYAVDGACSASLLAVITASQALEARDLDVALAGGVDLSLDPFELVGFARAGALAADEMRVYDRRSAGFWPGEGCGFVVLMREPDARAQGRRIYAIIRGWGMSSDGSGGITRPEADGQALALGRAYRRAGFGAHTIGYFEGHGTGTAVGDTAELQALVRVRREAGAAPPAGIGSIKANIGHTKAAAGIAGLLKGVLALDHRVVPPTTGCDEPHAILAEPDPVLEIVAHAREWPASAPMRVGVSAMGFGGINTHIVLEEAAPRAIVSTPLPSDVSQDAEVFLLDAPDTAGLAARVEHVAGFAARLSRAELTDLAATLTRSVTGAHVRAAVVASTPEELARGMSELARRLRNGVTRCIDVMAGIHVGDGDRGAPPRIAFLFPGQASPVRIGGGALAGRFTHVRELYRRAALPARGATVATDVAQPAIMAASCAGLWALERLGIRASAAVGHSLGEIAALQWAGVLDEASAIELARVRGAVMMGVPGPRGAMLSIGATESEVAEIIDGTSVVIAGLNLPRQTVVAGESGAIEGVSAQARGRGWHAARLPVSHAFHSPTMAPARQPLAAHLSHVAFATPVRRVASTITGGILADDAAVAKLLERQIVEPVRFVEAVRSLGTLDLAIEVGPGHVLAGLATELLDCPIISIDAGSTSLRPLLSAFVMAFALGVDVDVAALFDDRFTRPFDIDRALQFLANPCELAPVPEDDTMPLEAHVAAPSRAVEHAHPVSGAGMDAMALVQRLVAQWTELPIDAVRGDSRLLDDLHMNSIAVGQIAVAASKALGLGAPVSPTDYADATVAEMAHALETRVRVGEGPMTTDAPAGVESWIRSFTIEAVERPAPRAIAMPSPGEWRVYTTPGHPLRESLECRLRDAGGHGVVVCLSPAAEESAVDLLLDGARAVLATRTRARFVVVQQDGGGGAFARSFHLESTGATTCVIDVPLDHPHAVEWIVREALAADGYVEAHYDACGRRTIPMLRRLALDGAAPRDLDTDDVILVSGGGKGIGAECALAWARHGGARLALLGRSDPASDPELAANLERIRRAGVTHRYIITDVRSAAAVHRAIATVESEWGPVTAVLHAAGVNTPERVQDLTREKMADTLSPKLDGARHILAALRIERLKQFVVFGSIIARTGLRGEADYGLANEWLTRFTERFARRAPNCRCLSIEWSIWSGVGMGERLGRVDALTREGVTPITVDQGVAAFLELVRATSPPVAVVVSGRPGAASTLTVEPQELPLRRFLEHPRVHVPGVELVVDAELTPRSDRYLDDHVVDGVRLFPGAMGLEAMAQVATALAGTNDPPQFENVRFDRPVPVPDGGVTIRIAALARKPDRIDVVLRCSDTGFEVDHFRATCRIGLATVADAGIGDDGPDPELLDLDPARDLYGEVLFHGPRFQRITGYRRLHADVCVADLSPLPETDWFGRYLPSERTLGDTATLDAAIHAIQACIPHAMVLPVGIAHLTIDPTAMTGPLQVAAREVARAGDRLVYDFDVRNAARQSVAIGRALGLKIMRDAVNRAPWPPALLGPLLERRVAELARGEAVSVAVISAGARDRTARGNAAVAIAIGRAVTVSHRADGKPEVDGVAVSLAHAGCLTLAIAGQGPLGCDLEVVAVRTEAMWSDLLGTGWALAQRLAVERGESVHVAATRVWTALECAKKAGMPPCTLHAGAATGHDGVVLESGPSVVVTVATRIRAIDDTIVMAVLAGAGTR